MGILDLPVEIFQEILYLSILARGELGDGIARALHLKLVCRTFRDFVDRELFRSGFIDRCLSSPFGSARTSTREHWRDHSSSGLNKTWHAYLVHRCRTDTSRSLHRYVETRKIAEAFCRETRSDFEATLGALCWAIIEGHVHFEADARYCSNLSSEYQGILKLKPAGGINLLSAAAHLNNIPLAMRLLKEGTDPTTRNGIFSTPMLLAAFAGHRDMLMTLQESMPDFEDIKGQPKLWRAKADSSAILGAYLRGDVAMLKLAMYPPSRGGLQTTKFFRMTPGRIKNGYSKPASFLYHLREAYLPGSYEAFRLIDGMLLNRMDTKKAETILGYACYRGDASFARKFIDCGHAPVPTTRTTVGANYYRYWSPFVQAVLGGHLDVVDLLLEKGAIAKNLPYQNMLSQAFFTGSSARVVRRLIEHGATGHNLSGLALRNMVVREHSDLVNLILDKDWADKSEKCSALWAAVNAGYEDMVVLLWRKGARLGQKHPPPGNYHAPRSIHVATKMMGLIKRLEREA